MKIKRHECFNNISSAKRFLLFVAILYKVLLYSIGS